MKKETSDTTPDIKLFKKKGRPGLPESERKKPRRITVSDQAWDQLDTRLENLKIKTVSELVEKIGLGDLSVIAHNPDPIANIPIYRRLQFLMDEPVAIFWSLLGFTNRLIKQLGISSEMLSVKQFKLDEFQSSVILKASTIIFFIGYSHGDLLINNPSGLMRWLIFRILQTHSDSNKINKKNTIEPINEQAVKSLLDKIYNAISSLESAPRALCYQALKAKTIDGLTIKQISRIFMIQGENKSKTEIAFLIKEGLAKFRENFYINEIYEFKNYEFTNSFSYKKSFEKDINDYCHLALRKGILSVDEQDRLDKIILRTNDSAYLDFWLNEIDYQISLLNHYLDGSLRQRITSSLKTVLGRKKNDIDKSLIACSSSHQVRKVLEVYANREAETDQYPESSSKYLTASQLFGEYKV